MGGHEPASRTSEGMNRRIDLGLDIWVFSNCMSLLPEIATLPDSDIGSRHKIAEVKIEQGYLGTVVSGTRLCPGNSQGMS